MRRTISVISMGVLLPELNYNLSIVAFNGLLKNKGFNELSPAEWQSLLPAILEIDNKFMKGAIDAQKFRMQLQNIISEKAVSQEGSETYKKFECSDAEFDQAWHAMLGNVGLLDANINRLRQELPEHCEIVLVSGTNEIHSNCIRSIVNFGDIPTYLTWESKLEKSALYSQVLSDLREKKPAANILFVEGTTGRDPFEATRKRAQDIQERIKEGTKDLGAIHYMYVDPKKDVGANVVSAIETAFCSSEPSQEEESIPTGVAPGFCRI